MLGIAVRHPQVADVWLGMCPLMLRQAVKRNLKAAISHTAMHSQTYQKTPVYYRKAPKEVPKTLAEIVSELWKE